MSGTLAVRHPRLPALLAGRLLLLLSFGCAVAACSTFKPRPDASRFFFLTPYAAEDSPASTANLQAAAPGTPVPAPTVGLAEIGFPVYLERPELATRVAPNELRFSTNSRWAEPLGPGFTRVLAADLSARLGPQRVVRSPWYGTTHLDAVLEIEIDHFEPDTTSGTARVVAHWTLREPHGQRVMRGGTSVLERPLGAAAHHTAAVAALSQVLDDFSRDLAQAVLQAVHPATP
jgi:uncharacterized lipoprotein YmbA